MGKKNGEVGRRKNGEMARRKRNGEMGRKWGCGKEMGRWDGREIRSEGNGEVCMNRIGVEEEKWGDGKERELERWEEREIGNTCI
ncbi:hypothetical protein Pmani_036237 [Petrolisthes manimaculis]|uniref:Uncharacterized protein n=1 Tax=Petrolisthes manimaculis TaxID=1843537 RepID=A0AAE1NKK3_9EUCA|nr:hypothetical protein Pmani_036237 [Petrolisthes manimaculis]